MRSDINITIIIVIATSEWRAPRGRVCLIQETRCGHAWLTQIRRVPYGPGERSDAFPGRSPVCRADGRSCGTLAYAPFCSGWPSPVPAGVKHCSCGEPLPHTLALRCSLAHTHTHTLRRTSSRSLGTYIFICEFRGKNKPPSESNIWPASDGTPLLGSNWYSNADGPSGLNVFCDRCFELYSTIISRLSLAQFSVLHRCLFFSRGWCGSCLCQVWIPRTIGKDEFSGIANHKTPFFIYACRSANNEFLFKRNLGGVHFFPLEWEGEEIKKWRSGETKILCTEGKY